MNHIEKIARYVCTRMGYEQELEVSAYPGQFMAMGPLGHMAIPGLRRRAWELYAPIVREVLLQSRNSEEAVDAIKNEWVDPHTTPLALWRAAVDALLTDAVPESAALAFDREPEIFGVVGEALPHKTWKQMRGLE